MDDTTFSGALNPPVGGVNSLIGASTPAPAPAPAPQPAPQAGNAGGLQYQPNMSGVMAAGQNYAKAQGAQDVAGAEAMAQAAEQRSAADRAAVAQARSETKPIPAFVPTKETASDLSMIFGMLGVLGTALGGKAKTAGMEGMAAMTGMMQGYQQGRQDLYEKEYKQFQANLESIKSHNAEIQQELQYALKLSATDMEKGKAYAQLAMARLGAPVLQAKVQYEGVQKAAEWAHQMGVESARLTNQAKLENIRFQHQVASQAPQEVTLPDGTRALVKATVGPDGNVTYQRVEGYGPKPPAGEGINSRSLTIAGIPMVPEKEAAQIVGAVRSARDTLALVERAKSPEILFGELNKVSTGAESWWQRNVVGASNESSINASDAQTQISGDIDAAAKKAGLSANDKNVVFYKEAIFTILEAERAARGGSLLPVAVMKTLTPLLDPKKLTKEAFVDIMTRRATQLAQSTNLTQDQFTRVYNALPHISLPGATPPQPSVAPSAAQPAAGGGGSQTETAPPPGYPNARKAPDGKWYISDPDRPGKYLEVH